MSLAFQILGAPGADNALHVTVDTGQSRHRILFDCGEGVLDKLSVSEIQGIDGLCFSHFHMDHVAGFDSFFRHNYNRGRPVRVCGPEGTIGLLHHRFRGFSWNLHKGQPGEWIVEELGGKAARFLTCEAFEIAHECEPAPEPSAYRIETFALGHGSIPSIAYKVMEAPRRNIDPQRLGRGPGGPSLPTPGGPSLPAPGPWLSEVLDDSLPDDQEVELVGGKATLGELREQLVVTTEGETLAYLTDFALPDPGERAALVGWLRGTDTLVCEAQYLHQDLELARRNSHMTARLVGELARDAGVERLVLQHLSRRYEEAEWPEFLAEAGKAFPGVEFPAGW